MLREGALAFDAEFSVQYPRCILDLVQLDTNLVFL